MIYCSCGHRSRGPAAPGVGDHLESVLQRLGIHPPKGCRAKWDGKRALLNRWGPVGCRLREVEILTWLRREAEERGLPYWDFRGRQLLDRAVNLCERAALTSARQCPAP